METTEYEFNIYGDGQPPVTLPILDSTNKVEFSTGEPLEIITFERLDGLFVETNRRRATDQERLQSWLLQNHGRPYRDHVAAMVAETAFEARWNADVTIRRKL